MKKNRQIGTLIKCLSEQLPVLKTLAVRRPDLYRSSYCILCNSDEEEDQEHLATCSSHEKGWQVTEETSINLAWTSLAEETRERIDKKKLKEIIWGSTKEEKKESRLKVTKGLIQEKSTKAVQNLTQTLTEAKNFVCILVNTAWNSFYENIWKKRCEAVIVWEKELGISLKSKRKDGRQSRVAHEMLSGMEEVSTSKLDPAQIEDRAKKKEEDSIRIEETWLGSIRNFISDNVRPFFYSLKG